MTRFCLALDLVDDEKLIAEYETYHQDIWPEIEQSIFESGIQAMAIYRAGNRLFMIIEADENFSFDRKATLDAANPKVQEWEALMWKYQQAIPVAEPGQKWVLMKKIFEIAKNR
jgi:L-rhamnose mutarotase